MPSQEQSRPQRRDDEPDEAPAPADRARGRGPQGRPRRRHRQRARRDRRRPRVQRRGVRARFRPEGRPVSLGSGRSPAVRGCRRRSWRPGPPRSPSSSASHAPELLPSGRPLPPGRALEAPHGTTIVTLTYDGGVVMAGDRRATMGNLIANRDMREGLRRRRLLGRRHRRHGRPRDRAGQAVPGRARALREDRGHAAVAGGQGQPPGHDDPRQPGHGHAGAGGRAALRRVRPRAATSAGSSPTTSPVAATRSTTTTAWGRARCSPAGR